MSHIFYQIPKQANSLKQYECCGKVFVIVNVSDDLVHSMFMSRELSTHVEKNPVSNAVERKKERN